MNRRKKDVFIFSLLFLFLVFIGCKLINQDNLDSTKLINEMHSLWNEDAEHGIRPEHRRGWPTHEHSY